MNSDALCRAMAPAFARIHDACAASGTELIAVIKRQPHERILAAYQLGLRHFAHSYVQEAADCRGQLAASMPEAKWHFIGRIQSNKARQLQQGWTRIHSVDRLKVASRLGDAKVLIQVRLGGEHSKAGVDPENLRKLIDTLGAGSAVRLRGLMALPPPFAEWGKTDHFADLARLRDELLAEGLLASDAGELSMGTSDDYRRALTHGARWVRVGTALLGARGS